MEMIGLSWCELPVYDSFICDWTQGDRWLHLLCTGDNASRRCTEEAIRGIETTMSALPLTMQQRLNMVRLQQGVPVVIGGQQVGYWGGPLYTWLKIASTIHQAQRHSAVPIFWIEDNDHDLREASCVSIIGKDDSLQTFECPSDHNLPSQTIVAAAYIGSRIEDHHAFLASQYGHYPFGRAVITLLRQCYEPAGSWADAFLQLHHSVWGEYGLLFVRSSVLRMQGAMSTMIERELMMPGVLAELVAQQTAELLHRGYKAQARAGEVNVYIHHGQQRYRLHRSEDGIFQFGNRQMMRDQLMDLFRNYPEQFSPSVLLRPLIQDQLFAPVVTILGPAELQYHAQLRRVYSDWHVPKATLKLRHSATLLPRRLMQLVEKHQHEIVQFFQEEGSFHTWLTQLHDDSGLLEDVLTFKEQISMFMHTLRKRAIEYDSTLDRAVGAVEHRMLDILENLTQKFQRAVRRRQSTSMVRYRAARVHLFPNGQLQERTVAPIHLLCRLGADIWREVLTKLCQLSECRHYIVTPDDVLSR